MRDKKKILAILLFLIMGFFMFTFANPSDGIDTLTKPVDEPTKPDVKEDDKKDDNNNQTPVVVVIDNAPVITVNPAEVTIAEGSEYDTLTGVTVTDDRDRNLTATASITDTTTLEVGTHTITYTVRDSGNNTATATRTLVVFEDKNKNNIPDEEEDHFDISFEAEGRGTLEGEVSYADVLVNLTFEEAGIVVPTAVADEYYELKEWTPVEPTSETEVTETITYVAVFGPINDENENDIADEEEDHFNVTFVAEGRGTLEGELSYTDILVDLTFEEAGIVVPTAVADEYYELKGWTPVEPTSDTVVTETVTYVAVFGPINDINENNIADEEETYTVQFVNYNGKVLKTERVLVNNAATAPTATPKKPTSKGISYKFVGWDKDFSNITEDTVVTAQFEICEIIANVFEYLGNDPVIISTGVTAGTQNYKKVGQVAIVVDKDTKAVKSSKIFKLGSENVLPYINGDLYTEEGYTFNWYVLKYESGDGWHVDGVKTANTYSLDVTFKYKNGEQAAEPVSETLSYNEEYSVEVPEIEYYTPSVTEISGTIKGNVSINVVYSPINDLNNNDIADELENHYLVTFIIEGPGMFGQGPANMARRLSPDKRIEKISETKVIVGDVLEGITYATFGEHNARHNNHSIIPATQSAGDGRKVISVGTWHEADGTPYNSRVKIYSDKTFYLTYGYDENDNNIIDDQEEFTVQFLDEEGNVLSNQTVKFGENATAPDYSKEQTAQYDYVVTWDKEFTNVKEDLVVNAVVTPVVRSYDVIFTDYDGTQIGETQSVKYGEAAIAPENPTRENYTFTGWSTSFDEITGPTTVVAEYTANVISITVTETANANWKFTKDGEYDVKEMLVVTKNYADGTSAPVAAEDYTTDFSTAEVGDFTLTVTVGDFEDTSITYSVAEEIKYQSKFEVIYTGLNYIETTSDRCTSNCDEDDLTYYPTRTRNIGLEIVEHYEVLISNVKVKLQYTENNTKDLVTTDDIYRWTSKTEGETHCTWYGSCTTTYIYTDAVNYAYNPDDKDVITNAGVTMKTAEVYYTNEVTGKKYVVKFNYDSENNKFNAVSEEEVANY